MSPFYNYIQNKRIAVVGPAPSVVGSRQAALIDSYDIVMRFNKAVPILSQMVPDIGKRTDIICNCLEPAPTSGGHLDSNIWKTNGVKWVLSAYPIECWFNKTHAHNFLKRNNGTLPVEFPNYQKYLELEKQLGTRPNSGLCGIIHLLQFPVKEVYVTGMTFGKGGYYKGYCDRVNPIDYETKLANGPNHKQEPQRLFFKELVKKDSRIGVDSPLKEILSK